MQPYITFNGINSLDKGLRLVTAEPFIIPTRTRRREYIPGRIGSIAGKFEFPAVSYKLRFAMNGKDKGDVVSKLHDIANWVMTANIMTVWHEPKYYYIGSVESETDFSMLTKRDGQLEIEFVCDPPCRHKALIEGVFLPDVLLPMPEQINKSTVEAANQTGNFTLNAGSVGGSLPAAIYMELTGSWDTLNIDGLKINEKGEDINLYIDCEAQEAYKTVSGVRVPVKYSGDFPALNNGKINVSGTGLNLTAKLLVIERG